MRWFVLLVSILGVCLAKRSLAEEPLFEQDPFDQITLDEENNNVVLQVKPLDLRGRRLPPNPQPDDNLIIRLVEQPDKKYEVAWKSIRKVELFEQMVLGKANELVAAGNMDEAYEYFRFLEENYVRMSGLDEAYNDFLFKQAKEFFGKQRYRNALGVLHELYRRNPKRARLDTVMGAMTGKLIEEYLATGDYAAIRALLRELTACYPSHPLVTKWETRLKEDATSHMTEAKRSLQAGDLHQAAVSIRRVVALWPALEGAKALAETIHKQYPRVVVGVCQPTDRSVQREEKNSAFLSDWAARRDSRLVSRTLCEITAASPEGGQYVCSLGTVKLDETLRRFNIALKRDSPLSASDVARRLLAMADPTAASYHVDWAEILEAVTVQDDQRLEVELGESFLQPQALLRMPLIGDVASGAPPAQESPAAGPYLPTETNAKEAVYLLNPRYFARTPTQPQEIMQRSLADSAAGAVALRRGDIQILDHLEAWQVKSLRADENVIVQSYAVPRVHCLIPNIRKPLTANRTFRRALAYGINRQAVLEQLTHGEILPGCVPLHGPMAAGTSAKDPQGYASDAEVKPWPYDPRMAMALAEGGRRELAGEKAPAASEAALVLAYPADAIARTACTAIRQQLSLADIAVDLKELSAIPGQIPADVDLLYVELALWEPLVDVPRVLGENGIAGACSAPMGDMLRQLQRAADWYEVGGCLRRIDRLAHDEVAVVPLWQLPDYFAYRRNVKGIASDGTLSLYQNVEQWKLGFEYPSER